MTLSITIGKTKPMVNEYGETIDECPPESYDVCDPKYTMHSQRAYRNGTALWDFFEHYLNDIYNESMSNKDEIKPFIDEINALPDDCGDPGHNDRMKWFKFWCNRAVELYGDEAGVEFC